MAFLCCDIKYMAKNHTDRGNFVCLNTVPTMEEGWQAQIRQSQSWRNVQFRVSHELAQPQRAQLQPLGQLVELIGH